MFCSLNLLILALVLTLNLAFSELDNSEFVEGFKVYSCLCICVEILLGFFIIRVKKGKKITKIKDLAENYIKKQFWIDLVCLVSLLISLLVADIWGKIWGLLVCVKIPQRVRNLKYLEFQLFQSFYSQQYCDLTKIFLQNLAFSHVMAIFLVMMSWMDSGQNWLTEKGIEESVWF